LFAWGVPFEIKRQNKDFSRVAGLGESRIANQNRKAEREIRGFRILVICDSVWAALQEPLAWPRVAAPLIFRSILQIFSR
jgi:hypothetical protein